MKVYLVRHGETDWNLVRRIQGNADIPLNEKGRAVARATAEAIKEMPIDVIFSSPLVRARETAEILVAGRGMEVQVDSRLKEIAFGEFEGITWKEIDTLPEYRSIWRFFEDP
ncbi:MAG: histidine phosphatase family protein, partial [Lachnospiraceae bacterium]|nr:histidine phosphatase family protein [Lachnospiraceae bacterium]